MERFAKLWGETIAPQWQRPPAGQESEGAGILHFTVDGVHVLLTAVGQALIPEKGQLPQHGCHVMATFFAPEAGEAGAAAAPALADQGDPAGPATRDELMRRHRMVAAHVVYTEVMDSLMREPEAVGVFREELGVVFPPQMFASLAEFLTKGQAPLPLWINVRVSSSGLAEGRTLGLPFFGHLDLQVRESARSTDEVYDLLMNVANYIVTGDAYLLPGQTLGYSADQNLAISQEISPADGAAVIRLDV